MTYIELQHERFPFDAFVNVALDGASACWQLEWAPPWLKKSAPKVLKTAWSMMASEDAKGLVKHPWDTRRDFESKLGLVAEKMFSAGILLKTKGPGEGTGFYKVEEFGAGYLFGDVGSAGVGKKASLAMGWGEDTRHLYDSYSRMKDLMTRELDFMGACDEASLR